MKATDHALQKYDNFTRYEHSSSTIRIVPACIALCLKKPPYGIERTIYVVDTIINPDLITILDPIFGHCLIYPRSIGPLSRLPGSRDYVAPGPLSQRILLCDHHSRTTSMRCVHCPAATGPCGLRKVRWDEEQPFSKSGAATSQ